MVVANPASVRDSVVVDDEGSSRQPSPVAGRFRRLSGARPDALVIGCYVALALWVESHLLVDANHRVSEVLPQDHSWFEWLLQHGAYSVRHGTNPLFSAQQNAPSGVNMMANTSMLGVTIPLSPLTMWFGTHVSYVIMLGICLAGTATSTYWVMSRHLVSSRLAAAVGGLVCGFAPGFVHHASGQPNFTAHFLVPFVVLAVVRLGRSSHLVRDGAVLGLLVAYQLFINEEILLATVVSTAFGFVVYAFMQRGETVRLLSRLLRGGLVGVGVAGVLLAYPLWFQFAGPQSYHSRIPFADWGEDVTAFVTFSRYSLGNNTVGVESSIAVTEQNTWFGWPLLLAAVLAAVLLWRQRNRVARAAAVTGVVFALLSLGPTIGINGKPTGVPGPWSIVGENTPLLELMMPSRLSLVVTGVIGLLLALFCAELVAARQREGPSAGLVTAAAFGVVGIAVLTILPMPLPAVGYPRAPRFITSGQWREYVAPGRTLVPVPLPDRAGGLSTFRWSAAGKQEFPIAAGYFLGRGPNGELTDGALPRPTTTLVAQVALNGVVPPVTDQLKRTVRDDLAFWKAGAVVLGDYPNELALVRLLDAVLGPGTRVDDVWVWKIA
jgi:hypothetical protein